MKPGWRLWLAQAGKLCRQKCVKTNWQEQEWILQKRERGRAGVVIKRAGPSMKESKKSTVSVLEQQSWGPKALYLGDDRKLHCKARSCGA